jgi:restriction endonuclease Mrr
MKTSLSRYALSLSDQLQRQLVDVNFSLFASVCRDMLAALGYENIQTAGRLRFKGKNRDGGYDLEATLPSPTGRRKVIIQLKQYEPDRFVYQRYVNELIGVALRVGASEAVIVTTGKLSHVLEESRHSLSRFLIPVRLIDGDELLRLLIEHEIGVKDGSFDGDYFAELAMQDTDFGEKEAYRLFPMSLEEPTTRLLIEIDLSPMSKASLVIPKTRLSSSRNGSTITGQKLSSTTT